MEVNFNTDSNKREYIDSAEVNRKVKDVLLSLQKIVNNASSRIKNDWLPTAKEWVTQIGEAIVSKYVYENVELLTKDQLIEIIKNNMSDFTDSIVKSVKFHIFEKSQKNNS